MDIRNLDNKKLIELKRLLVHMSDDEHIAPYQYQKIIDLLPTKVMKDSLRINQRQEKQHYKRVNTNLAKVNAELKRRGLLK